MKNLKEQGFTKLQQENGWVEYNHEDGYVFLTKVFEEKLVLLDNFSVSPVVVSLEELDENNFEETLELVYNTNEIASDNKKGLSILTEYVSENAYKEAKEIFDYNFGN